MIHFPSTLQNSSAVPRRSDSLQLNATQQKSPSHQIFLTIEEELHDARRVHAHGQEEDLRLALNMVIERLSQLSTLLSEAYKTSADLEVQLNVTKSNLKLVISNNEMLEDALKQRDSSTAQSVGWRRTSVRQSTDEPHHHQSRSSGEHTPVSDSPSITPSAQEGNRFFKFRFTSSSPNPNASTSSRPGTPQVPHPLNSPSLPVLPLQSNKDKEQREELEKELEKEKKAAEKARKEKEALEAELESLSQALFEEANKMVATERIRRADVEEELKEARDEQQALRSALRLLEGENSNLRSESSSPMASFHTPPSNTPTSTSPVPSNHHPKLPTSPSLNPSSDDVVVEATSSSSVKPPHRRASSSSLLPSLSSLPKRRTPPPPAPLGVPTTPFIYSPAVNGEAISDAQQDLDDMTTTPRRVSKPLEHELGTDYVVTGGNKTNNPTGTKPEPDSEHLSSPIADENVLLEDSEIVDSPTPILEDDNKGKIGTTTDASPSPPPPSSHHPHPPPPMLHLFSHEEEQDPWAGATSGAVPASMVPGK